MTRLDDFQLTSGGVSLLSFPAASPGLEKFGFKFSSGGAHISRTVIVVPANPEVADKLGVAFLPSIPLFASVGDAGGGFLGFLSPANGASV